MGPERGNKAAVGQQKGFLDPKRLHAAGASESIRIRQGIARGTSLTSWLNVRRFWGGRVMATIPCQRSPRPLSGLPCVFRLCGGIMQIQRRCVEYRGILALSPAGRTGIFRQMRMPYCRCAVCAPVDGGFPVHFIEYPSGEPADPQNHVSGPAPACPERRHAVF